MKQWIEWDSGRIPVAWHTVVEVRHARGVDVTSLAKNFNWGCLGRSEVTGYRLASEEASKSFWDKYAKDEWIVWDGRKVDIRYPAPTIFVEVKFRNGHTRTGFADDLWYWGWETYDSDFDIVAYRLAEPGK